MKKIILLGSILLLSPMYGNIVEYSKIGDLEQVKTCIQNGADINIKDKFE